MKNCVDMLHILKTYCIKVNDFMGLLTKMGY